MSLAKLVLAGATALLLTGCAGTSLPASVSEGTCKVFPAPTQAVRGWGKSDQAWINDTVESGVAACHWARPQARAVAKVARKVAKKSPTPRKVAKRAKPVGIYVDAILPVPALPEPEPPPPPPQPSPAWTPKPDWMRGLLNRLDGR